jgi:hypothetical protein
MERIYYRVGEDEASDEVSVDHVVELIREGIVTAETLVWQDGMEVWLPLAECASLFVGLAAALYGDAAGDSGGEPHVPAEGLTSLHYHLNEDEMSEETSVEQVKALVEVGTITAETKVWGEGMEDWVCSGAKIKAAQWVPHLPTPQLFCMQTTGTSPPSLYS